MTVTIFDGQRPDVRNNNRSNGTALEVRSYTLDLVLEQTKSRGSFRRFVHRSMLAHIEDIADDQSSFEQLLLRMRSVNEVIGTRISRQRSDTSRGFGWWPRLLLMCWNIAPWVRHSQIM